MSTGTVAPLVGLASLAPVIWAVTVSPAWTVQNWELRMPPVQDLLPAGRARAPAPVAARAGVTKPAVTSSARAAMMRHRRCAALILTTLSHRCGRPEARERLAPLSTGK